MRKQLGVLSSFIFICTTALIWVGCGCCGFGGSSGSSGHQQASYYYDSSSVYSEACAEPICPQRDDCAPRCCETARRVISNFISCDGVRITASQPDMCLQGDQYALEMCVEACAAVCDVTISTTLPEGVVFVRSDPEAEVIGPKLVWHLSHMDQGESRGLKIWLRCEREGALKACFCVTATPVAFCTILCAKPVLCCTKCGPEDACPGDCLNYTITVSNKGSCTATDVVVTDLIPSGLEHISGQNTLCFKLGDICPCETKCLNLTLKATECGRQCNRVVVTACNADESSCEWCTQVCRYCCEIIKEGPKEVRIGQNADYKIAFTNIGDKPITEVVIVDDAPCGTSIVSANGAAINGNRAVWRIDSVDAGKTVDFGITLTTCTPGYYCNRVSSTNAQCTGCCAEWCTRWKGVPALNICVVDLEDPICVGDTTTYKITVVNQGSEVDSNVRLVARFPAELTPLSARGASAAEVKGQTVTFAPVPTLGSRQTIEYRIDARAKSSGDARVKVEVMSDSITTPIVQEESTIVN